MASTAAGSYASGASADSTSSRSRQPKLDFREAMRDFKSMFPSIDDDVIEEVLRANKGSVDATIDHLIAMGTEESEAVATTSSVPTSSLRKVKNSAAVHQHASKASNDSYFRRTSASRFNPPLVGPLPDDFLRIRLPKPKKYRPTSLNRLLADSGRGSGSGGGSTAAATAASLLPPPELSPQERMQILEDERIALYLQNEEFMKELRRNREFIDSLERDQTRNHMLLVYPPKNRHPTATRPPQMHRNYNQSNSNAPERRLPVVQNVNRNSHRLAASGPVPASRERYRESEDEREGAAATTAAVAATARATSTDSSSSPPEQMTTLHGLAFEAEAQDAEVTAPERKPSEELTFHEKMKHMSKNTRKKLHQLAQLFMRRKKKQANLGSFDAASTANLLNSEAGLNPSDLHNSREVSPEDVEYGEEPARSSEFYRGVSPEDPVEFYSEDFYPGQSENDC